MQKTILVTGGAGYVGSVLVRALLNKGYKVRVLDKLIFTEASLKGIEDKIELVKEDIQNVDPSVMDNVAAVYHLAGFSSEPVVRCSPRYANLVNHMAVERIAKMAKEKGVERFIFASSCSVYFTFETSLTPSLINENDPINPISAYAISKRAAEEGILDLSDHKFHPIIFRKGTIFGFSQKMRYDLVLNAFTRDAFLGKKLTVNSGGQVWRPLLDIQDAVWAYIQALEMPLEKVSGKMFNVCNKNWTT